MKTFQRLTSGARPWVGAQRSAPVGRPDDIQAVGEYGLPQTVERLHVFYRVSLDVLLDEISPCLTLLGIFQLLQECTLTCTEQFERW